MPKTEKVPVTSTEDSRFKVEVGDLYYEEELKFSNERMMRDAAWLLESLRKDGKLNDAMVFPELIKVLKAENQLHLEHRNIAERAKGDSEVYDHLVGAKGEIQEEFENIAAEEIQKAKRISFYCSDTKVLLENLRDRKKVSEGSTLPEVLRVLKGQLKEIEDRMTEEEIKKASVEPEWHEELK